MRTRSRRIEEGWVVRQVDEADSSPALRLPPLPADVPGSIHLDLQRAGVIPDPFVGMHEKTVAWVDETDWTYETDFSLESLPAGALYLRFEGLDTIAEIGLNGEPLGTADNMFVPHEFEIAGRVRVGTNHLQVTLRSAARVGRERLEAWTREGRPSMASDWFLWSARSFVRKAQYMFGWDWGPQLISCGIWRPVALVHVPRAHLRGWRHDVRFDDGGRATVTLAVTVERISGADGALQLRVELAGASAVADVPGEAGVHTVSVTVQIDEVRRWFPHGVASGPFRYDLLLQLNGDGEEIDEIRTHLGLRTVELVQDPDPDGAGSGFRFRINGLDVFARGANWIPAHSFPALAFDESAEDLTYLLTAARDAGITMLRVWGGGLYESDTFYDLCDRLGIMVWQDFPYACAYYPDEGEYASAARREAEINVRRLRVHPSLALWCGNNENQQAYHDRWAGLTPPRFLGERLYEDILPAVVRAEDPRVPYWPGSAYGGENPNSPDTGDRHNWDVWHAQHDSDGDWPNYRRDNSRFCSEFGFASSCGLTAWDRVLSPEERDPFSLAVRWHDKTRKGYEVYLDYVRRHYPDPHSLEDLVYYSQLNQADAMKCGVEHYRRLKGRCWGSLIWQLNDCWPVQSWALIDAGPAPKAAYYAARRFYAPLLLSLLSGDDEAEAYLVNDLGQPVEGEVRFTLRTFSGETLAEETRSATVGANAAARVAGFPLAAARGREREVYLHAVLRAPDLPTAPGNPRHPENFLFLAEPKELELPAFRLQVMVEDGENGGFTVRLGSDTFVPAIWLSLPGEQRPSWSDNFFHLQPGEQRVVHFQPDAAAVIGADGRDLRIRTLADRA